MIPKEIKKKKIAPLVKTNRASNPSKKKISKINSKRVENKNIPKHKTRARSTSVASKGEPKKEQLNINHSFKKNSLELDYLNFSQLDIFKLNESFEEDIFTPNYKSNNPNNNKKIILNRYDDSNSTINDNSNIINNNNYNDEFIHTGKINDKENLINTPSTICNYYEESSNKNKNEISKYNFPSEGIKKNLDHYYNINNLNNKDNKIDEKDYNNIIKEKKELNRNNSKKDNIDNIENLVNEIFNPDKLIKNNNHKLTKEEIKNNDFMKFYSNNPKINKNKNKYNNCKENVKTIDYNFPDNKINVNLLNEKTKIRIGSQEKQINYYYNQNKNDGFFITPRNINKKNDNSTKSTKLNTKSIGKAKSFSSKKINKTNYINNKMYLNNNKMNNNITNYKIIKELIKDNKDMITNKHKLNKTTPKNKNPKNIKNNTKCLIKVNLKNKTKSSSNINTLKKQIISEEKKNFNAFNNNNNNINNKIKSEIKSSFAIFQNIYKTINKSGIKSPDKDDNNNLFKVSKTLTENNIIHKIQATPKNYKIQKFDSIPFTTIVKKIFIGSSKKDNLMKFDSSMKKKEKTKTEQMKCIFKPKTQSDFKPYNNILGNEFFKKSGNNGNGEYGNDRHVKQKLLDRMNKATNNWNYIFKANKNKKVLDDGISNIKSQNKEYNNYFYKNENIISDGSEKEDEDNL